MSNVKFDSTLLDEFGQRCWDTFNRCATVKASAVQRFMAKLPIADARSYCDIPRSKQLQVRYFMAFDPSVLDEEISFSPFGVQDLKGKSFEGAATRDLSEFRLVVLPRHLASWSIPLGGRGEDAWSSRVYDAFHRNTLAQSEWDATVAAAAQGKPDKNGNTRRPKTYWQEGLMVSSLDKYSHVLMRVIG